MKYALRYIFSLLLLFYLVSEYSVDILSIVGKLNIKYVLIIVLISMIQYLLSAYRWMYISSKSGHDMNYIFCIKYYYISGFLNNILPGGVIGDIYRAYSAKSSDQRVIDLSKSITSIVLERLSGQIMLILFFIVSLSLYFIKDGKYEAFLYMFIPVLVSILVFYFIFKKIVFAKKNNIIIIFRKIFTGIVFWNHTVLSFFVVISYITMYIISAQSLGINVDYLAFFVFTPIILFSMTLPVSIGGWGVREGTALLVALLLGLSSSSSISVAILYGFLNLLCALPGLYFLIFSRD